MRLKTLIIILAGLSLPYKNIDGARLKSGAPKSIYDLHYVIKFTAAKHNINPDLFLSIVKLESNFKLDAYNKKTQDFGLTQVNLKTAKAYGFDVKRLKTDFVYNLNCGAIILSDFKKRYSRRESKLWVCRYNVGTGPLKGARLETCLNYLDKVTK